MENLVEVNSFPNLGYLRYKFTKSELEPIRQEVEKIKNNFSSSLPHNKDLAGQILNEYKLVDTVDYVARLMLPLVATYDEQFGGYVNQSLLAFGRDSQKKEVRIQNVWVNFQGKHEFNPIHSHLGVLSFVIWLDIPYDISSELNESPGVKSNHNLAGHFNFHIINTLGEVKSLSIPADSSYENQAIIFPALMRHSVSPFYSSENYRVSVAGNFEIVIT